MLEGRRHLSILLALLFEQGDLEARVEALEAKFASLDQVIRRLHSTRVDSEASGPQPSPPESRTDLPGRPPQR
jgi:hypothetical protein